MKTILLIDDDEDEFLIFSEVLDAVLLPLNCVYHSDPQLALIWLHANLVDFIFIDMIMPKMTGIELMQKMKELPSVNNSKFVLLSTYINDKLFDQAITAGATTCIQKLDTVKSMAEKMKDFFSAYKL